MDDRNVIRHFDDFGKILVQIFRHFYTSFNILNFSGKNWNLNFFFNFKAFLNNHLFKDILWLFLALLDWNFNLIENFSNGFILDDSANNPIGSYQLSVRNFFNFFLFG